MNRPPVRYAFGVWGSFLHIRRLLYDLYIDSRMTQNQLGRLLTRPRPAPEGLQADDILHEAKER
jgi:hypothetical protein